MDSSANGGNRWLYLLARNGRSNNKLYDDCDHHWFVIRDDEIEQGGGGRGGESWLISPIPNLSRRWPNYPTFACLDSTIYIFGGNSFNTDTSKDFWLIDTTTTHDKPPHELVGNSNSGSCIKGPSMILARSEGCAVAVGRKIFVFGYLCYLPSSGPCSWAEIYDIDKCQWLPFDPPAPAGVLPGVVACVSFNEQFILVYFEIHDFLYAYYLESGQWSVFDLHFGNDWQYLFSVSSGTNILLAINVDWIMYGYHIGRREWFHDPVKVLDGKQLLLTKKMVNHHHPPFHIVSLGSNGKLCILWTSRNNMVQPLHVTCTTFKLREENDGTCLIAIVESTKEFHLVDVNTLLCCMPVLAPRRERKRGGDSNVEDKKKFKHMFLHPY